jgi:hypothetical protein
MIIGDLFVTYTVGEYRKLVEKPRSVLKSCYYQVKPDPVNMKAAHVPCQDL